MADESLYVSNAYGRGWDAGYMAGRSEALGTGAEGLLEENAALRAALAKIGRKGNKPLPGEAARQIARKALSEITLPELAPRG